MELRVVRPEDAEMHWHSRTVMLDDRLPIQSVPMPANRFIPGVGLTDQFSKMGIVFVAEVEGLALDDCSGDWTNGPMGGRSMWIEAARANPHHWGLCYGGACEPTGCYGESPRCPPPDCGTGGVTSQFRFLPYLLSVPDPPS